MPFTPVKLTKFNNHYYGTPKYKWVYYPNKTSDASTYFTSQKRHQYLLDFANEDEKCMAFTSVGELKHCSGNLITHDSIGTWVREKIPENEHELPVN